MLGFELQTLHDNDFKLSQSKHITLSQNLNKTQFIISYNHYLQKNFRVKKSRVEVKISNLINYLTICCQNGKDTTIFHCFQLF